VNHCQFLSLGTALHRDPTAQAKLDKLARQRGSIGFGQPPVVPGGMMMFKGYPFNNENTIWEDADDKTAIRCARASKSLMTALNIINVLS
jgi:hypothetical protein